MKTHVCRSQDADMQGVMPALLRAAERARETARQTGTKLVVVRDGKLVYLDPDTLYLDPDTLKPTNPAVADVPTTRRAAGCSGVRGGWSAGWRSRRIGWCWRRWMWIYWSTGNFQPNLVATLLRAMWGASQTDVACLERPAAMTGVSSPRPERGEMR